MFFQKGTILSRLFLGEKGLTIVLIYLCVLYAVTTVVIFPEHSPKRILPHLLIFIWYLVALGLLWEDRFAPTTVSLNRTMHSQKELGIFAILVVGATIVCSLARVR